MTCESVALFSVLAGWGLGLLTALVAHWAAAKLTGEPMIRRPEPVMAGLEVRDSTMGEFDAVAKGNA